MIRSRNNWSHSPHWRATTQCCLPFLHWTFSASTHELVFLNRLCGVYVCVYVHVRVYVCTVCVVRGVCIVCVVRSVRGMFVCTSTLLNLLLDFLGSF
jgi:hypothetical protein